MIVNYYVFSIHLLKYEVKKIINFKKKLKKINFDKYFILLK